MPDALLLTLAIALVLVLVLVCVGMVVASDRPPHAQDSAAGRRTGRPPRSRFRRRDDDTPAGGPVAPRERRRAAVVANPTKFSDVDAVRRRLTESFERRGWAEPLWLETTVEDPGRGQAERALAEGVELVCSLGGDGTVRNIAGALVGTGVPLGLLPGGTGNLLARNLDLPVGTIEAALDVAIGGRNRRIDAVRLTLERPLGTEPDDVASDPSESQPPSESQAPGATPVTEDHLFLVMAGIGFDAELMAGASEEWKSRAGWLAYVASGARHLKGPQFRVEIKTDTGEHVVRRVRSVLVGNVGRLTGGMVLLPDAKADDGMLDSVVLSPKGMVGWVAVGARLLTRRRRGHTRVEHLTSATVSVRSDRPVEVQLDGDTLGQAVALDARVEPLSLLVRVQS